MANHPNRARATKKADPVVEAARLIDEAKSLVEEAREAAQEKFDDRTEKWQESEAGQKAQEHIDTLESAGDSLDEALGNLNALD